MSYEVTDHDPHPESHLRVDVTEPAVLAELHAAFMLALTHLDVASASLGLARYALMDVGYKDSHPVCKDIDQLNEQIADRVKFAHDNKRLHGEYAWPVPEWINRDKTREQM